MKKFILWDPRDGYRPTCDEEGNIISAGILGVIERENCYLTIYPEYDGGLPLGQMLDDLLVGESIKSVKYSLSGSKGVYDIYRVK